MKRARLKSWVYAIPAMPTSRDRQRGRASMVKRNTIVKIHRDEGDRVIIAAKCKHLGTVLASVARSEITLI